MPHTFPSLSLECRIVPGALFLGVAVAFLSCCLVGRQTTQENQFGMLPRFHQRICPETQFYPTASQVLALTEARLRKKRIAVIIGGSSIMNGVGQHVSQLWTDKLQELLGDDYRVLNLAMRAGQPSEFAAVVAERFCKQHRRLIFVSDVPGFLGVEADAGVYQYLYWDAYYKGFLKPFALRQEWIRSLLGSRKNDDKFWELRRQMWLDQYVYATDLWNTLAFTRLSTVWTPLVHDDFTRARGEFPDNDPGSEGLSMQARFPPQQESIALNHLRSMAALVSRNEDGEWVKADTAKWAAYQHGIEMCFPDPELRKRMLCVYYKSAAPIYFNQLSDEEKSGFAACFHLAAQLATKAGASAVQAGDDFTNENHRDWRHLSESGGARLAEKVAPEIRKLARQLGYMPDSL